MQNSSIFCRTQEAIHARRATESGLSNVRSIATAAAAAWAAEAESAERRETRHQKRVTDIELTPAEEQDDRDASENPDRGFFATV